MLTITLFDAVTRIIVSVIAGLLIGFVRKKYPAGIRTFTLICLGATIFTIISIDPAFYQSDASIDPTRIIAQIVTGIGFIGAGVIWKSNIKVGGLTTAAAIWTSAAIGILLGLGEFILGILSLLLVIIILASKRYFDGG